MHGRSLWLGRADRGPARPEEERQELAAWIKAALGLSEGAKGPCRTALLTRGEKQDGSGDAFEADSKSGAKSENLVLCPLRGTSRVPRRGKGDWRRGHPNIRIIK